MKWFKHLLLIHATYILITAVWPIVHIESFMLVTGPKQDIWLVKTVGALLIPISITMLSYLKLRADPMPVILLGSGTALSFICIDLYYALSDIISDIYLLDALAEVGFLCGWIWITILKLRKS